MFKRLLCSSILAISLMIHHGAAAQSTTSSAKTVSIILPHQASDRIRFGATQLQKAIEAAGMKATIAEQITTSSGSRIIIGEKNDRQIKNFISVKTSDTAREHFTLSSINSSTTVVAGNDASGVLYGCMELADRIRKTGAIPSQLKISEGPEMVLRGACIGLQKPAYLPGRHVYEYPYTPENFPWFYDKALWLRTLDSLVENRMNALFLWNGHPFASLVKLKDYPYAVEVDDSTFAKNQEIFSFLTTEADRRGIWVIQMFYNIIVSQPFAEKHGIKTQDRNRPIVPLIADYTQKSIAAFVQNYPNVGLMVALGEAMEGVGQDDIDWFTKTIIPGVKDGLKASNRKDEPPIVLRAHDTDAPTVMEAALPLYKHLYTEAKYNGEALTTYTPRGPWAELHRKLASLGSIQIENVHILANLEPFRYGSPQFISRSVKAMHAVHHGNGLHLYPQASYWDWPYSADKTATRLYQIDRDWIWYKAWSRYAWKAGRDPVAEKDYWSTRLGQFYGIQKKYGAEILKAYDEQGEIAPKLLRRFGITDGNRQTLTLGMLMTQLINPYRYGLFTLLYNSEGPEGEMLTEYAEKEWKKEKHTGETPVQVINEVRRHGQSAVAAINNAAPYVKSNKEEFKRLQNDMRIYKELADHFADKASASLDVLRYKYSNDISDLEKGYVKLKSSVEAFRRLTALTKGSYLYANSMQTGQRKIPVAGTDGTFLHWKEMLPVYTEELRLFRKNIDSLRSGKKLASSGPQVFRNADVNVITKPDAYFNVSTGKELFTDTATYIKDFAPELPALNAFKLSKSKQIAEGTRIVFTNKRPVKVLVGYFNHPDRRFLQPPQLETDASANDYGQAEPKLRNALIISGMPPVNIHTFTFKPGTNTLSLGKGAALILGFVDDEAAFPVKDAGLIPGSVKKELDWLFE